MYVKGGGINQIDAAQRQLQDSRKIKLYIYADDIVVVYKSKQELHDLSKPVPGILFQSTKRWSWKGGNLSETDFLSYDDEMLKNANRFRYTSVSLYRQPSRLSRNVTKGACAFLRGHEQHRKPKATLHKDSHEII